MAFWRDDPEDWEGQDGPWYGGNVQRYPFSYYERDTAQPYNRWLQHVQEFRVDTRNRIRRRSSQRLINAVMSQLRYARFRSTYPGAMYTISTQGFPVFRSSPNTAWRSLAHELERLGLN